MLKNSPIDNQSPGRQLHKKIQLKLEMRRNRNNNRKKKPVAQRTKKQEQNKEAKTGKKLAKKQGRKVIYAK